MPLVSPSLYNILWINGNSGRMAYLFDTLDRSHLKELIVNKAYLRLRSYNNFMYLTICESLRLDVCLLFSTERCDSFMNVHSRNVEVWALRVIGMKYNCNHIPIESTGILMY